MKYPYDFINQIICGDCLEVMKGFPDNSIDTIITDPPYGLEFMGKDWDKFGGKPIDRSKEDSSLGIHRYFKGNKPIYNWDMSEYYKFIYGWATQALRVARPGATLLCFGGTRTYHRLACAIEDAGWVIKDCVLWIYGSGFPKATDISKQIDKTKGTYIEGKETVNSRNGVKGDKGNYNHSKKITENNPQSSEATLWNGWKSHGLKPAYEPILVAMKPNEGSYASNALKWGVAGLNIDGGRIEGIKGNGVWGTNQLNCQNTFNKSPSNKNYKTEQNIKGRYPSNVILDEEAGRLLDEQSGVLKSGAMKKPYKYTNNGYSLGKPAGETKQIHDSSQGGASRFFYCAKASKAERNRGCEGLEGKQAVGNYMAEADWIIDKRHPDGRYKPAPHSLQGNHHPTVKPLALMKYLVTLTKMPNPDQIYLDPFCGSGTTLMACKESKRNYIGIDNEKNYVEISKCRIKAIPDLLF